MPTPERSAQSPVTTRDLMDAINELRRETSEARHNHANATARAINELRNDMDNRMRSIELELARSSPSSLGPRIGELEQWRSEMRGGMASVRLVAVVASVISGVAAVISLLRA